LAAPAASVISISDPRVVVTAVIEFAMGFGLGYYGAKAFKYIVAAFLVLVAGSLLSVWSLGGSPEAWINNAIQEAQQAAPIIKKWLAALGILTVGPTGLGFVLGAVKALAD